MRSRRAYCDGSQTVLEQMRTLRATSPTGLLLAHLQLVGW